MQDDSREGGGIGTPGRLQGCKRLKSYGTGFPAVTEEAKAEQFSRQSREHRVLKRNNSVFSVTNRF